MTVEHQPNPRAKVFDDGLPIPHTDAPVEVEMSGCTTPEQALATIRAMVGNVDHSRGGGSNTAKMYGDMLVDIRKCAESVKPAPTVEAEETEAMIMLRRLHDAMSVALEFRRLSATPKERAEAKAAIQVWRDVELYLKGKPPCTNTAKT